jgi:hypothetical protein
VEGYLGMESGRSGEGEVGNEVGRRGEGVGIEFEVLLELWWIGVGKVLFEVGNKRI